MFNQISRKLRSRSGASMLLAMVFMLFCLFVGSTVLAASTANSYRVAHLSDQQEYLDQRSAALLLQSQLTNGSLNLVAAELVEEKEPGYVGNGGVWISTGTPVTSRTLTFTATGTPGVTLTAMQRLALESAVHHYLELNYPEGYNPTVYLVGFGTTYADMWTSSSTGSISVTGTANSATFASFQANYLCDQGFNFLVNMDTDPDAEASNSQMAVAMKSVSYTMEPIYQEYYSKETTTTGTETTTQNYRTEATQNRTMIIWRDPVIEKGGTA